MVEKMLLKSLALQACSLWPGFLTVEGGVCQRLCCNLCHKASAPRTGDQPMLKTVRLL